MKIPFFAIAVAVLQLFQISAVRAQTTGAEERNGLRRISSKVFPVPDGSKIIPEISCDFESGDKLPAGWGQGNGEVVAAADAPQGKAYFRMDAKPNGWLASPAVQAEPDRCYFVSFWIKTAHDPWLTISFTSGEREPSYTEIHTPLHYANFPLDTGGQWREEGYYFWMPPQCKTIQLSFGTRNVPEGQTICLDDIQVRTASESEMSGAIEAERAQLPPYDVTPRPGDGKNLALTVAKLEGRAGIPGKPFVIWALGSSFTDMQGDGYLLIHAIRERFPNAPQIIYRKHGGPGTPWEYVYAWVRQFVAAEQPDLIFTYTSGTLDGLDKLLTEIRTRTTAEVIVPSLHFRPPPSAITPENITHGMGTPWDSVREICEKHGAEFVANREEMAAYLAKTGLDQDALLVDHNHQGMHGRIRIWDNVVRHIAKCDQSTYTPESRERMVMVASPVKTATEEVSLSGSWSTAGGLLSSSAAGAHLKATFTGNQIDLIGRRTPGGGSVKVLIDGVPADQAPVFLSDFIKPHLVPADKKGGWRIPHLADLGPNLVPQTWTITMTSDTGDFRLEGSVAGPDGTGNLAQPFVSRSGQISLDPKNWRQGRVERPGQPVDYGVLTGETFTFDVYRSAVGEVSFKGESGGQLVEPLVRNLPNGKHTLELVTTGDGEVAIQALYVFEPPEK
jgi:hypothetical protein